MKLLVRTIALQGANFQFSIFNFQFPKKVMNLTEHFTLEEFTRSEVAAMCDIDNTMPEQYIPAAQNLCAAILEPLRNYAQEPVIISSGYRCPLLNDKVGGVKNSQHTKGEAADIYHPESATLKRWFTWIQDNTSFDQLIFEGRRNSHWIHVSCRTDLSLNRQQILRR